MVKLTARLGIVNTTAQHNDSFSFSISAEDGWYLLAPEDCRPLTSIPSDVIRIIGSYLSNVNSLCRTCSYFWSIFHTEYTFHFPTWHWVEGYLNSHKLCMPSLRTAFGSRTEPLPRLQVGTLIVRPTATGLTGWERETHSSAPSLLRGLLKNGCSDLKVLRLADWDDPSDDGLKDVLQHTHKLEVLEIRPVTRDFVHPWQHLQLGSSWCALPLPATLRILKLRNLATNALFAFCNLLQDHQKFPNLENIGLSHCDPKGYLQTPQHEYSPPSLPANESGGGGQQQQREPPVLVPAVSLGFSRSLPYEITPAFELLRLPTHICVNYHTNWPILVLMEGHPSFSCVTSVEIVYDQDNTKSTPVMLSELPKQTKLLRLSVEFQFLENKFHDDAEFPSSLQEFALHFTHGSQFDVLSMALVLENVCERCLDLQRIEIWALQTKNWEEPTKVAKALGQVWPPPTQVTFPLVVMVAKEVWEISNLSGFEGQNNLQFELVKN
eukprot:TRINITY_DN65522_c0_g2_i1.p1 TRINITY_DN65522_c0_g2~~TRINITY_DN65522_c0_g2_i1.p1  ORF type:complete len:494 (-),score=24.33 TRINITY_DN65522_c0_g2_i1:20-1501(-)